MAPSRNSWSFTIHLYWDFSKSWSQIQKVGVNYSKFGVNETSDDNDFTGLCRSIRNNKNEYEKLHIIHL